MIYSYLVCESRPRWCGDTARTAKHSLLQMICLEGWLTEKRLSNPDFSSILLLIDDTIGLMYVRYCGSYIHNDLLTVMYLHP